MLQNQQKIKNNKLDSTSDIKVILNLFEEMYQVDAEREVQK